MFRLSRFDFYFLFNTNCPSGLNYPHIDAALKKWVTSYRRSSKDEGAEEVKVRSAWPDYRAGSRVRNPGMQIFRDFFGDSTTDVGKGHNMVMVCSIL